MRAGFFWLLETQGKTFAPDIVLLATEWRSRAPLRAQLIEEGFEVLATNSWPAMKRSLRPGSKPRLAIVDLKGLPQPDRVLSDLAVLMKPDRVLVLTALGAVPADVIERFGFRVQKRPAEIGRIVEAATRAIDGT